MTIFISQKTFTSVIKFYTSLIYHLIAKGNFPSNYSGPPITTTPLLYSSYCLWGRICFSWEQTMLCVLLCKEECLLHQSPKFYKNVFLFVGSTTFRTFLPHWFTKLPKSSIFNSRRENNPQKQKSFEKETVKL